MVAAASRSKAEAHQEALAGVGWELNKKFRVPCVEAPGGFLNVSCKLQATNTVALTQGNIATKIVPRMLSDVSPKGGKGGSAGWPAAFDASPTGLPFDERAALLYAAVMAARRTFKPLLVVDTIPRKLALPTAGEQAPAVNTAAVVNYWKHQQTKATLAATVKKTKHNDKMAAAATEFQNAGLAAKTIKNSKTGESYVFERRTNVRTIAVPAKLLRAAVATVLRACDTRGVKLGEDGGKNASVMTDVLNAVLAEAESHMAVKTKVKEVINVCSKRELEAAQLRKKAKRAASSAATQ